ncbi:PAN-3 domain-containing protein [Caenorhabditis elegans]|uniref:PAN-3 domain-containing protein n=1 Tax=Caenorhabditis elegans TaxID=6239 RepID=O17678_CAEEL|nr:PAN-3 domain-containing protein [Caenorhabditis elegans]CAB05706.3 PAN-3 domain-containing protein [Caenorhabditis elegans]|eukprot:NP_493484.2 C-type LECtin [Caenorhabditis elegans]
MVLIFGQPVVSPNYSNRTATISFCSGYCFSMDTCVAVYVEKGSKNCQVFSLGQLKRLRERESSTELKIAVKMEFTANTCSKTATANTMKNSVATDTSYLEYTMTVNSESQWIFTTTITLNCPVGYRLFKRPKGFWCIGVTSVNQCITQVDSVAKCKASEPSAILSGLQSMEETNYVYGIGQPLLKKDSGYYRYGYWVNGERKSSCMPPAKKSASCNSTNEFSYTDPLLSAYAGYQFAPPDQPDGLTTQDQFAKCLNLLIGNTVLVGIDDNGCNMSTAGLVPTNICYKGYVCGVKPTSLNSTF